MRKLIMWNIITLDGYFEGNENWDLPFHNLVWGKELEKLSIEQLYAADYLVFGRVTYEGMAAYWTKAEGEIADLMNEIPKLVFSGTLKSADWNNSTLIKENASAEISKLKTQGDKDMYVFGSAGLSETFINDDLFDEYRIGIAPVILGSGRSLFRQGISARNLSLLIRKFENNPQYKVFLSTEAGGSGLNLQVADTLINFELPWNPAKKNQRIGRIDRLGQKSAKLTIFNFITRGSIEDQIASGLLVKQSLFDSVLGDNGTINSVDFSSKGRSQFIQQLEAFIAETEKREQEEKQSDNLLSEQQDIAATASENLSDGVIDLSGDDAETPETTAGDHAVPDSPEPDKAPAVQVEELEKVMNNGLQFLSGLFKMTTGKEMGMENQKIEVNRETGEVTMRFKLPV